MSYLSPLRLHFAGRFLSNVSTVNNDPAHFNNSAFKPGYQLPQGPNMMPPGGWFNPQGDAAWRFLGCTVTSAWMPAGQVGASDPVLGYIVADSDTQAPAKLVDLDSEQQLVSEIWGLQVRIATTDGSTLMVGDYEPAAFFDIWDRSRASSGGDTVAGATYQSVLRNLQWGDVSSSPFLTALQQSASDGLLSIKFNVDSFNLDSTSADFMTGRVVGTIGPASASEPQHLVLGRQFMTPSAKPAGNFFSPAGNINFCVGVVDAADSCIYLDLGNALPTGNGGAVFNLGDLTLSVYDPVATPGHPAGSLIPVGSIPAAGPTGYTSADWYSHTAGVVVLPVTPALLAQVQRRPLAISGTVKGTLIAEPASGAFVRADTFVYRMSPGDRVDIDVYATQWGAPLAGAEIVFELDPSQLQPGSGFPYVAPSPPVATPTTALSFAPTAMTDHRGIATFTLAVTDPGLPRIFGAPTDPAPPLERSIDGQVYGIRPGFSDTAQYGGPVNQWNFISLLLWSGFSVPNPPTWNDLKPIFQQYANLYPVMNRFLDLGNYESVVANAGLLSLAFGLEPANPNAMPVTRDLSPARRSAILTWLKNPIRGIVAPEKPRVVASVVGDPPPAMPPMLKGGKVNAAARRLVLQAK